jgi:hypothetical protein
MICLASKNRDISYGRQIVLKRQDKVGTRFRETREIDNANLQVFVLLFFVLMRYKTWIEDSQKMTRKIKFDLQFFMPRRLRYSRLDVVDNRCYPT